MEDIAESDFSAKERGLIGFVRRANLAPSGIIEEEFQALKGFGATDAEIVEALGVMELFVGFNKFLDSLHVDIDFPRRGA
jgi:alkylhydroperoxidase family enzyme